MSSPFTDFVSPRARVLAQAFVARAFVARAFVAMAFVAFALAFVAVALEGCGTRGRPEEIASLLEGNGTVERASGEGWQGVSAGAGFIAGDAVRTGPRSSARLRVTNGGTVRMGEKSLVRFRRGTLPDQSPPEIGVDFGQTDIEESGGLSIVSPAGRTQIDRGAHVRINASGDRATVEVIVGRAVVTGGNGDVPIQAGQGITFRIGGAILETFQVKVGAAVVEPATGPAPHADPAAVPGTGTGGSPEAPARTAATASSGGANEKPDVPSPWPEHPPKALSADITFPAGEKATLHSDRSLLSVRLRTDRLCPGEARVELAGRHRASDTVTAPGEVILRLRAGTHRYAIRCADDPPDGPSRAEGVLSLKRDRGDTPLPRSAPANTIDGDGRRYTVLFQTRIPALTFAWDAPAGITSADLHVESSGGATKLFRGVTPHHRLPSGTLPEGSHTWWYVASDGRQSPKTTLTLRFDDTTPTAQFFRARAGDAGDGPAGAIAVDGVVVPGAKVSTGGRPIEVDSRGHFAATVSPVDGDDAVAVRVETALGGARYYVRRREGKP